MKNMTNELRNLLLLSFITMIFGTGDLSAFIECEGSKIGQDSSGQLIAVWSAVDSTGTGKSVVRAKTWDLSTWSAGETLSDTSLNSGAPELAVNSAGNAAVVWKSIDGSGYATLQGTMYDISSEGWEPFTQLSDSLENLDDYEVTINDDGEIAVIWGSEVISNEACRVYVLNGSIDTGWDLPATQIND